MRLAVIPGDGIGPEVIDEALKVLNEVVPGAETTTYDLGRPLASTAAARNRSHRLREPTRSCSGRSSTRRTH